MIDSTVSFFSKDKQGNVYLYTSYDAVTRTILTKFEVCPSVNGTRYLKLVEAKVRPLGKYWTVKPTSIDKLLPLYLQDMIIEDSMRLTIEISQLYGKELI